MKCTVVVLFFFLFLVKKNITGRKRGRVESFKIIFKRFYVSYVSYLMVPNRLLLSIIESNKPNRFTFILDRFFGSIQNFKVKWYFFLYHVQEVFFSFSAEVKPLIQCYDGFRRY